MKNLFQSNLFYKKIFFFIIALVLLLLVFLLFYFFNKEYNKKNIVLNINNSKSESTKVYKNDQYGISFDLSNDWSFEEVPSFVDGAMTYDGKNISFEDSNNEKYGFQLTIIENENNYLSAEQYVNNIINDNKRLYENGEAPYIWEYDNKNELELGEIQGYILENMKGPGGYQDIIYAVSEDYIFEFRYSYSDEEGISRVDDDLSNAVIKILKTLDDLRAPNNNETENVILSYENGLDNDYIAFTEAGLKMEVPNGLIDFTEEEINRYNSTDVNNEYYLWRACRSISKETSRDFLLWVSFDEQDVLCGTERFMALLSEPEYSDYGDDFCNNLEKSANKAFTQYYGCENLGNPPVGFNGYEYYEYIPDFGIDNSGTIVKEVFLENNLSPDKRIIIGYAPAGGFALNIKPAEFQKYVALIQSGQYDIFNKSNENVKIFNDIVNSLEIIN